MAPSTNREVADAGGAVEPIDRCRTQREIELLFHVFRNGCRVEALQPGSLERVERALAVYLVAARRIVRLMRLRRTCPDLDAERLLGREQWQVAYPMHQHPVPKRPPPSYDVIRRIALRGGFPGHKGDGRLVVKTLQQGLQRRTNFVHVLRAARESAAVAWLVCNEMPYANGDTGLALREMPRHGDVSWMAAWRSKCEVLVATAARGGQRRVDRYIQTGAARLGGKRNGGTTRRHVLVGSPLATTIRNDTDPEQLQQAAPEPARGPDCAPPNGG